MVGVQGQVKVAKKSKTHPLAAVTPANPKPKTKTVFFDFKQKTCWIRGWFG